MMDDEGEGRLTTTFGDNHPRLAALKKKYNPGNLFRVNPPPGGLTAGRRFGRVAAEATSR